MSLQFDFTKWINSTVEVLYRQFKVAFSFYAFPLTMSSFYLVNCPAVLRGYYSLYPSPTVLSLPLFSPCLSLSFVSWAGSSLANCWRWSYNHCEVPQGGTSLFKAPIRWVHTAHLHEHSQALQGVTTALSCCRAKTLRETVVLLLDLVTSSCVHLQSLLMCLLKYFRIIINAEMKMQEWPYCYHIIRKRSICLDLLVQFLVLQITTEYSSKSRSCTQTAWLHVEWYQSGIFFSGSPGPSSDQSSRASSPLFDSGLHLNGNLSNTVSASLHTIFCQPVLYKWSNSKQWKVAWMTGLCMWH